MCVVACLLHEVWLCGTNFSEIKLAWVNICSLFSCNLLFKFFNIILLSILLKVIIYSLLVFFLFLRADSYINMCKTHRLWKYPGGYPDLFCLNTFARVFDYSIHSIICSMCCVFKFCYCVVIYSMSFLCRHHNIFSLKQR